MVFEKQVMTDSEMRKTDLFKEIDNLLKGITIKSIDDNNGRTYKQPSSGENCIIYNLDFQIGITMRIYVATDGRVTRVEIEDKVIGSTFEKGESIDMTAKEVVKTIAKFIKADEMEEFKRKFNPSSVGKLINSIKDDEVNSQEVDRLEALKQDLTKGSGKFIIVNDKQEFYSLDKSFSTTKSNIKTFEILEDAQSVAPEKTKIVRI